MYYQKEDEIENNDEEISPNQSSEELRVLTENNNKKNGSTYHNPSIEQDSVKKTLNFNDDITDEIEFKIKLEEQKDNPNVKVIRNKNNFIEINAFDNAKDHKNMSEFEENNNKEKTDEYHLKENIQANDEKQQAD